MMPARVVAVTLCGIAGLVISEPMSNIASSTSFQWTGIPQSKNEKGHLMGIFNKHPNDVTATKDLLQSLHHHRDIDHILSGKGPPTHLPAAKPVSLSDTELEKAFSSIKQQETHANLAVPWAVNPPATKHEGTKTGQTQKDLRSQLFDRFFPDYDEPPAPVAAATPAAPSGVAAAIAPSPDFFKEVGDTVSDDDLARAFGATIKATNPFGEGLVQVAAATTTAAAKPTAATANIDAAFAKKVDGISDEDMKRVFQKQFPPYGMPTHTFAAAEDAKIEKISQVAAAQAVAGLPDLKLNLSDDDLIKGFANAKEHDLHAGAESIDDAAAAAQEEAISQAILDGKKEGFGKYRDQHTGVWRKRRLWSEPDPNDELHRA